MSKFKIKNNLKIFFVCLPFIIAMPNITNGFHKHYIGLYDLNYNKNKKSIEIVMTLFIDDLDEAIWGNKTIPNSTEVQNTKISNYIKKHFKIKIDGEIQSLLFLGFDKDNINNQYNLLFEVKNIQLMKEISVFNDILTEIFKEQKNITTINLDSYQKTYLFTRNKISYIFKLKN